MIKKVYCTDKQIHGMIQNTIRQTNNDDWKPDYIVAITRGGLVPGTLLSHYLGVPLETLKISLVDGQAKDCESNCWMAEDACGYGMDYPKKILVIDDIVDEGRTFNWLKEDWNSSVRCMDWSNVWNNNVRFASLVYNKASGFKVDYFGEEIDKSVEPAWYVFPWENWWEDESWNM